jgi:hypothetical protein
MVAPALEILRESVHGREVLFVGVDHTAQYFDEKRAELDDLVRQSALVVPEHFPPEYPDFDPNEPPSDFYGLISELAKQHAKQAAVVDPEIGPGVHYFESALGAVGILAISKALVDAAGYVTARRRLSRRNVLTTSAAALAAYSLTKRNVAFLPLMALEALVIGPEQVFKDLSEYGIDDTLAYELHNYRDVCAAIAMERVVRSVPNNAGPVVLIYGRTHPKVIVEYLKRPAIERNGKIRLYLPFSLLADQTIRRYEFGDEGWTLAWRERY